MKEKLKLERLLEELKRRADEANSMSSSAPNDFVNMYHEGRAAAYDCAVVLLEEAMKR